MPDFFALSKLIPLVLYPLPFILLSIFALSWGLKKNPMRWLLRILVVVLWTISTPWFANQVTGWWEIPRSSLSSLPAKSDVAIVLGGMSDPVVSTPEHLELSRSAERITEAVGLWRQGRVKAILITSGSGDLINQKDKEAPGLAAWAQSMGVPPEALVVESASRNTQENATLSLPLAQEKGFRSFVLITSASHMRRSEAIFRKAGYADQGNTLTLWAVDTLADTREFPLNAFPDPSSLTTSQMILKEVVGYAVYWVRGYL